MSVHCCILMMFSRIFWLTNKDLISGPIHNPGSTLEIQLTKALYWLFSLAFLIFCDDRFNPLFFVMTGFVLTLTLTFSLWEAASLGIVPCVSLKESPLIVVDVTKLPTNIYI